MATKNWRELSPSVRIVYLHLKYHFNGRNNGKITVSMRILSKEAGVHFTTVNKAIKELIQKEWVEKTEYGGLFNNLNSYKLTGKYDNWIKDDTKRNEAMQTGNNEYMKQEKTKELMALSTNQ